MKMKIRIIIMIMTMIMIMENDNDNDDVSDILHKKTHKLYSNISIHLKSITKNTSNFHSDAKQ